MPGLDPQSRACYNCRRRRLRCDRSVPACRKCSASGEECRGYGVVLRWANAPALRGKLARPQLTVRSGTARLGFNRCAGSPSSIPAALLDPLWAHLNRRARQYVHHFSTAVCRDLVSFDQHARNPFRAIIPLSAGFGFLEAIIVATGAMHIAVLRGDDGEPGGPALVDALVAKDRAIRLLRAAVNAVTPATQPMVLAATVFLVNLDLIDSGKGGWQAHMEAASTLMSALHSPPRPHALDRAFAACVDAIAADCLTYRVLSAAISGVALPSWPEHGRPEFLAVLQRAEAHSYHGCPPEILLVLLSASTLCGKGASPGHSRVEQARALFQRARSLDVVAWVHGIRGLSAHDDLAIRVRVALAHRATACLYVLLAVPEAAPSPRAADALVREALGHLAAVPVGHVHLKGTVWPTFVVGAQTDDPAQRKWCSERMCAVWSRNQWVCPWGYIRTAVQTMQQLWQARDKASARGARGNWLLELKSMRDKCLIV